MTPERWRQVRAVFDGALERPASERAAYLDDACRADPALRDEVRSLLRSHQEAGTLDRFLVGATEEADGPPPQSVGPYRIVRPLGRGGMGAVYLGVRADDAFRKEVAVKVLSRLASTDALARRFRAERQILANLEHLGIARLLDGGSTEDGRPFLVMEHVEGTPLDRHCDERRLDVRARLALFRKVCAAVHFAHQNLVVHRDLKPGNVLVTAEGEAKLLDFGIAKILDPDPGSDTVPATEAGWRPMTPGYASPEQLKGEPITTASDVYSLGVILYELLTGRRPHRASGRPAFELVRAVCEEDPEPPSRAVQRPASGTEAATTPTPQELSALRRSDPRRLSRSVAGDLDNVVRMALHKDPRRRYASAGQLSEDVERHLKGLPVLARGDSLRYRAGKFVRRHRAAVAAAGAVAALLLGFTLTLLVQRRELLRQRNRAEAVSAFLTGLFAEPDPTRARGEAVTARQVLDRGSADVRRRLAAQPEALGDLLDTMGQSYQNLGLYDEAEPLLGEALALRRGLHPPEHPDVTASLQRLADLLAFKGAYPRAEALNREALELRRRHAGRDDPRTAESLLRLARILDLTGEYAAAEEHFRDALAAARRLGDRALLATALDRFAILLGERGRDTEAAPMFGEALALYRAEHGDVHPEVALTLNNLALLEQRRDYDRAEALLREAESLQRRLFAGPHPHLATTLNNRALLAQERERHEKTDRLYAEALEMQRTVYGGDHPKLASTLNNLAGLRHAQGRNDEAERGYREARAMLERVLGEAHPETANTWNNLAQVLLAKGRLDEAAALFARALEVTREGLGPNHRRVAAILNNLGHVAQATGDLAVAEERFRESLRIQRGAIGDDHPDVAVALYNLGLLLRRKGDLKAAEAHCRQALATARRRLGAQHPNVAAMETGMAAIHNQRGRPREAEALARHSLEVLGRTRPPTDRTVLAAERALADSLVAQARYADAEPLLLGVLRKLEASAGATDAATVRARQRVVALYETWGRPRRAADHRRKLPR